MGKQKRVMYIHRTVFTSNVRAGMHCQNKKQPDQTFLTLQLTGTYVMYFEAILEYIIPPLTVPLTK